MSVNILCPKCKNPLEIPTPAPERIACAKCGQRFKTASDKPSHTGSSSSDILAGHAGPKLAIAPREMSVPVPVEPAVAVADVSPQAVAEPAVARSLAAQSASEPAPPSCSVACPPAAATGPRC